MSELNYTTVAKDINKDEAKGPKLFIVYKLGNPLTDPYINDIMMYLSETQIENLPEK